MTDIKKRKVRFSEIDEENKKQRNTTTTDTRLHSGKYTLESDEEDDDQDHEKQLNAKELKGCFSSDIDWV